MKTSVISRSLIEQRFHRLDASVYDPSVITVTLLLANYPQKLHLNKIARIWMPGRFKRYRVESPETGVPFLTASEIILAKPQKVEFISRKLHEKDLANLLPKQGTILITRSGTIGFCALVTTDLSEFAISEDAIRIEPYDSRIIGYIYAYLTSNIGQILITRDTYGSVVDHIEPFHLDQLEIPEITQGEVYSIHERIILAWQKRHDANRILDEAYRLLEISLDLKEIKLAGLYQYPDQKIFNTFRKDFLLRLDASFYDPPGLKAIRLLQSRKDCRLLGDVCSRIFHPFRMNMVLVDKNYGVPFLGGGDINQFRYFGDKYISPATENYDEYILQRGWTLMTIGGTIGYVSYVGDYLSGFAASQHVTRFIPDTSHLMPGYLFAFMNSDYAQLQVRNLTYGSVVDTIRESQLEELLIPVPTLETQKPIHDKVEQAFRLRCEANRLEDEAQHILVQAIGLESNDEERR